MGGGIILFSLVSPSPPFLRISDLLTSCLLPIHFVLSHFVCFISVYLFIKMGSALVF